ncbi:MAG: hypothetical protein IJY48_06625 [Mailhella sp.]|nr:hypothetical protein [Mailhella sp.]
MKEMRKREDLTGGPPLHTVRHRKSSKVFAMSYSDEPRLSLLATAQKTREGYMQRIKNAVSAFFRKLLAFFQRGRAEKPSAHKAVIIRPADVKPLPPVKAAPKKKATPSYEKIYAVEGTVHRIPALHPCSRWTLCIDEAGSCFCGPQADGRVVGVLFPSSSSFRYLPQNFHASRESFPVCASLLNELLRSEAGIVGIQTRTAFPGGMVSFSSEWICSVKKCIHLALMQLPVNERTKISILVEQRGEYDIRYNTRMLLEEIRREFARVTPKKAARVQITMLTFSRKGTLWLGWADLVAYFWGAGASYSRKRFLARSGLSGSCLLENARQLEMIHNI